tara:strand:+ start:17267 stop:17722 length:456 start_codon:yes stop_codon:yes gene_type:complete
MNTDVIIVANPNSGNVVTERMITDKDGNASRLGVIQVQQKALTGTSIVGGVSKRTAFITLNEEALEFVDDYLVDGGVWPQEGRLAIEETLKPWVSKDGKKRQDPKINPSTQEVITYQGKPVYRNTFFTTDLNVKDIFLKESKSQATDAVTE